MIRITFLGTSHGVPEKDRFCSSTLIEIGDDRYLVDMGGPVTETLIRRDIPLETIKAVFITHPHGDHTNGLIGFAANGTVKDLTREGSVVIDMTGTTKKSSNY